MKLERLAPVWPILMAVLVLAPLSPGVAPPLWAGDHTDSPLTRGNQAADLADVYVFPVQPTSATSGPRLVMIQTVFPYASPPSPPGVLVPSKQPGTRFSDHVEYVFLLRPASITGRGAGMKVATDGGKELRVTCTFDDDMLQKAKCVTKAPPVGGTATSLETSVGVDEESGGPRKDFRVFAGARADPFFVDPGKLLFNYLKLPQLGLTIAEQWVMQEASGAGKLNAIERRVVEDLMKALPKEPEFEVIKRPRDHDVDWGSWPKFLAAAAHHKAQWLPLPTPFIRDSNVLAIVVELDLAKAYGGAVPGGLFAVAAETIKGEQRIDRDARPTTLNLLFAKSVPYPLAKQSIPDIAKLQDQWNQDDTFNLDPQAKPAYAARIQDGITLYDSSDGEVLDWPTPNPMMEVLLTDVLLVDVNRPTKPSSDANTYLEIEMSRFRGEEPKTGGGRTPNDDSVDTFLTWFINGPERYNQPRRTDGEDKPSKPATDTFPYLRDPHGVPKI